MTSHHDEDQSSFSSGKVTVAESIHVPIGLHKTWLKDGNRSGSDEEIDMHDQTHKSIKSEDDTLRHEEFSELVPHDIESDIERHKHGIITKSCPGNDENLSDEFQLIASLVEAGSTLTSEQYKILVERYKASMSKLTDLREQSKILEDKLHAVEQETIAKENDAADKEKEIVTEVHRLSREAKLEFQKREDDYDRRKRAVINCESQLRRLTQKCKETAIIKLQEIDRLTEKMENEKEFYDKRAFHKDPRMTKSFRKMSNMSERHTGMKVNKKMQQIKNTSVRESSAEELAKDENIERQQFESNIEPTPKNTARSLEITSNENISAQQGAAESKGNNTDSLDQSTPMIAGIVERNLSNTGNKDDFESVSFNFSLSGSGRKQVARKKQRSDSDIDCSSDDEINKSVIKKSYDTDANQMPTMSPMATETPRGVKRPRSHSAESMISLPEKLTKTSSHDGQASKEANITDIPSLVDNQVTISASSTTHGVNPVISSHIANISDKLDEESSDKLPRLKLMEESHQSSEVSTHSKDKPDESKIRSVNKPGHKEDRVKSEKRKHSSSLKGYDQSSETECRESRDDDKRRKSTDSEHHASGKHRHHSSSKSMKHKGKSDKKKDESHSNKKKDVEGESHSNKKKDVGGESHSNKKKDVGGESHSTKKKDVGGESHSNKKKDVGDESHSNMKKDVGGESHSTHRRHSLSGSTKLNDTSSTAGKQHRSMELDDRSLDKLHGSDNFKSYVGDKHRYHSTHSKNGDKKPGSVVIERLKDHTGISDKTSAHSSKSDISSVQVGHETDLPVKTDTKHRPVEDSEKDRSHQSGVKEGKNTNTGERGNRSVKPVENKDRSVRAHDKKSTPGKQDNKEDHALKSEKKDHADKHENRKGRSSISDKK